MMRFEWFLFRHFADLLGSLLVEPLPHDVIHRFSVQCFVGKQIVDDRVNAAQ